MPRKRSLTSRLYRVARLSDTLRAAGRGPAALAKRQVRRRVYRKSSTVTGTLLRTLGMQGKHR